MPQELVDLANIKKSLPDTIFKEIFDMVREERGESRESQYLECSGTVKILTPPLHPY